MAYIGKVPTSVPLTSSDITDGIITTAKIADDAVDENKLDLTANYDFTGTITGAGGGKVLQVVQATDSTTFSSTSNSFVATGDTISITPASTSSKILVSFGHNVYRATNNNNIFGKIYRKIGTGSYSEVESSARGLHQSTGFISSTPLLQKTQYQYLDSPSTTSEVTYQSYFRNEAGGGSFEIGEGGGHLVVMQCIEFES